MTISQLKTLTALVSRIESTSLKCATGSINMHFSNGVVCYRANGPVPTAPNVPVLVEILSGFVILKVVATLEVCFYDMLTTVSVVFEAGDDSINVTIPICQKPKQD